MKNKKIFVLYHDDPDGWCSMYAAWVKLKDLATYIKVQYNKPFPISDSDLIKSTDVYILDFSYSREILDSVNEKVGLLRVIDHHETAAKDLEGVPYALFDMSHSGAYLSWVCFNGDLDPIPKIVLNVEDYDLYKFEMEETRAIDLAIRSSDDKYDPNFWEKLANPDTFELYNNLYIRGLVLLNAANAAVKKFINKSNIKFCEKDGYKYALYNTGTNINQIAETLLKDKSLELDYTISYFILAGSAEVVFNFRTSEDRNINVADIVRYCFGPKAGGHKNAAGAVTALEVGFNFIKTFYK